MKKNKKILSFITDGTKFLALYHKGNDPSYGGRFWFTVTGSVEKGEDYETAVRREIKEETRLDSLEIFSLNWMSIYEWGNELCEEMNFITLVKRGKIKLNEEHDKYKWVDLDNFAETIKWRDDKKLLKNVLEKALKKEKYFQKLNLVEHRRK